MVEQNTTKQQAKFYGIRPKNEQLDRHANPSLLYVRAVDARDEPEYEVGDGRGADML